MKRKIFTLVYFFLNILLLFAQPSIQWQKSFGGLGCEEVTSIHQTLDGGYIIAGGSNYNDGDVSGNFGSWDFWIVKINSTGVIEWEKNLGGTSYDYPFSIQQTNDKGFIIAGESFSNDSDVSGNHGNVDCWILKLDSLGFLIWQKSYGGSNSEIATSIQQTTDGGYIMSGWSDSNNGDLAINHGYEDYWLVKLDSTGSIIWQRSLGGTGTEKARSIVETSDGGYIVCGSSLSNDGDVTGNHGNLDYWIVKLNGTGDTIQWQKSYGGSWDDMALSIQLLSDGGYVVSGSTYSNDGDVTGNHNATGFSSDYWIVKLNSTGIIQWSKCLGGTLFEDAYYINQTNDSGFIIAGLSNSSDGDVTGNTDQSYWIVKLNQTGLIQWQKCYGGTQAEVATSIQQTLDGGYIVGGESFSNDGDVTGNHGCSDYWIIKLDSTNSVNTKEIEKSSFDIKINPNPFSFVTSIFFKLSVSTTVFLEIRDVDGRIVKYFNTQDFSVGINELMWDATNNAGGKVDNGIYFITTISDNFRETKKVVLIRN